MSMPAVRVVPVVPVVLQAHYADYGGTDRWDRWDHHEDEVGEHRSHRLVPPLQHQIPWSTTGTTRPTEKLKAEDLGYPHERWIRSMHRGTSPRRKLIRGIRGR